MDFQHRVGGKTGSGGVASEAEANRDRRERLRQLALDTIDLNKDPYFMKNHLGTYECKLCLTLHNNEGSYLAHTQGIFILYYILSWFYIRFIWVLLFTFYTEYRFFYWPYSIWVIVCSPCFALKPRSREWFKLACCKTNETCNYWILGFLHETQ